MFRYLKMPFGNTAFTATLAMYSQEVHISARRDSGGEIGASSPPSPSPSSSSSAAVLSSALASALRELLSSTLGVEEECVRQASLPDLVAALRREWETLLEGLVSNHLPPRPRPRPRPPFFSRTFHFEVLDI